MFVESKNQGLDHLEFDENSINHKISVMFDLLSELHGSEQLVLKAGKLNALDLMDSNKISERLTALARLVYDDPTINKEYTESEFDAVVNDLENNIAYMLAKHAVEKELEAKVAALMQERHQEYLQEIQAEVIKQELGADNAQTLKKYAELEMLEAKQLSASAVDLMRPSDLSQIVGQKNALTALLSKLSSPFPQHIIIYGPPGVGKTTAARLALDYAKTRPYTPFEEDAPFVEVDGTTLRWDPRRLPIPPRFCP